MGRAWRLRSAPIGHLADKGNTSYPEDLRMSDDEFFKATIRGQTTFRPASPESSIALHRGVLDSTGHRLKRLPARLHSRPLHLVTEPATKSIRSVGPQNEPTVEEREIVYRLPSRQRLPQANRAEINEKEARRRRRLDKQIPRVQVRVPHTRCMELSKEATQRAKQFPASSLCFDQV
jgi:hypothetical protein